MSRPRLASSRSWTKPPWGCALPSSPSCGNHSSAASWSQTEPFTPSLLSTKVATTSRSTSGSHGARNSGSTASFTETERGPRTLARNLLFQPAKAMAVWKAATPMNALLRCVVRVVAEARSSTISRSDSELMSRTPSFPLQSASGLPSTPCTHEPPRSTGAPTLVSVQTRPPTRSRASSTVTLKPESCSRRAATRPAMPAPITITRSGAPGPIDHDPVIRAPGRAVASCR